ncbi:MAG: cupin-like domain-containing protein [Gemmataceae bacterium]
MNANATLEPVERSLEQAAPPEASKPELSLVDETGAPRCGLGTGFLYWSYYLARHYLFGPKYGHFGPQRLLGYQKWLEKRIEKQSERTGEIPVRPVPRIPAEHLSAEEFQRVYLTSNTPVVIEGLAKDWDSVKTWSPHWFKDNYGDYKIPVRIKADALDSSGLVIRDMSVAELVDNLYAGGKFMGGNLEDIFNDNPHLRDALDIPLLTKYAVSNKHAKIGSTQLFMSGPGTRSGFHCTNGINLFVQVHGNKEWTFVNPRFSKWMYPITRKDMFYAGTLFDWKKAYEELEKDGYPLYKYVPKFQTLLQPGDVLFSPQWWWHAVNTPTPTVAVATRTMNRFFFANRVFSGIWLTSKEFRRLLFHTVKTGWGSDRSSGARLAFEEDFVNKTTA